MIVQLVDAEGRPGYRGHDSNPKVAQLLAGAWQQAPNTLPEDHDVNPRLWSGSEWVPDPGAAAALDRQVSIDRLVASDPRMARIVEDLWEILQAKGLVSEDDLAGPASERLRERRQLRADLT